MHELYTLYCLCLRSCQQFVWWLNWTFTYLILARFARLMAQKSWTDWCTWLLRVWCLQIHYEGVSGPKNRQIFTHKSLNRFLVKKIALHYSPWEKATLKSQDTPIKVTFLIENYKLGFHFSWWWFNRKCTFQDGGCHHLEFRKTAAISLEFDPSSPKLMETLRLRFGTYWWRQKCIYSKIKYGGRRYLEFRKTVAISLLFDQSSPNLIWILLLWFRTHRWRRKST